MRYIYLLLLVFALATCGASPTQNTAPRVTAEQELAVNTQVYAGQGMIIVATVYSIPVGLGSGLHQIVCHTVKVAELGQPSNIATQCVKL